MCARAHHFGNRLRAAVAPPMPCFVAAIRCPFAANLRSALRQLCRFCMPRARKGISYAHQRRQTDPPSQGPSNAHARRVNPRTDPFPTACQPSEPALRLFVPNCADWRQQRGTADKHQFHVHHCAEQRGAARAARSVAHRRRRPAGSAAAGLPRLHAGTQLGGGVAGAGPARRGGGAWLVLFCCIGDFAGYCSVKAVSVSVRRWFAADP